MRITIQAKIERADGTRKTVEVLSLRTAANKVPASGLGLMLGEARDLSAKLQRIVLEEQVAELVSAMSRCPQCSAALPVKDAKNIVYRTAFGKAKLASPRLYSRCSSCGYKAHARKSFSPLAEALPARTNPQWVWLQTRYASAMSYELARKFLAHSFTGATELPACSIRSNVQRIGAKLESEMQGRIDKLLHAEIDVDKVVANTTEAVHALQVDAGYVRSIPRVEGTSWISVIASKVVRPESRRTHAHAYSIGYEPLQGLRQEAFLASVGIGRDVPVAVLCDGGEDVYAAGRLGERSERILDWFHIGMRFEHLHLALQGLRGVDQQERDRLQRSASGAKWLLWHGQADRCLQRLEGLRRNTGWVGKRNNALGRLIAYLEHGQLWLVNYGLRRRRGLPISSAGAESAVDHLVGQRMKRNGHMRWTRRGANHLLQVRCAVLNGQDVRNFK